MFSSLKKNKTLRSLLSAAALFAAGAPSVVQAAPKAPQKMTQSVINSCDKLVKEYTPVCEQLEENLPYCYLDEGIVATGIGVRFKLQKGLENLTAVKLTLKDGTFLNLAKERRAYLFKMANADWKNPKTLAQFPEVKTAEEIKLKDCDGDLPVGKTKRWDKTQFIVMPKATLSKVNQSAVNSFVQKAYEKHPNLFQLPSSAQLVVVDLMYNLGTSGYLNGFPKFRAAVAKKDLVTMKKECTTLKEDKKPDVRRNMAKKSLLEAAILASQKGMTKSLLIKKVEQSEVQKAPEYGPSKEPDLWEALDKAVGSSFDWYQKQQALKAVQLKQRVSSQK